MREDDDSGWPVIAVAILTAVAFLPVAIYHEVAMLLARIKERARYLHNPIGRAVGEHGKYDAGGRHRGDDDSRHLTTRRCR